MAERAEHDWVEQARSGEPAAIAGLYQRYWRAARAAAYGVTGDLSLPEDAASEDFFAAMEGLASLRDPDRFGPWLRTIVVRTARRLRNATCAADSVKPPESDDPETPAPGERLERQEFAALVQEAVRILPPILREAISLFYFENYTIEAAARFLDVPTGTLKRRLHDGRKRLQAAAERILQGSRPMSEKYEQILQQLREAAEEGLDSEAFYQVIRKAAGFGPVPREALRDIMKRHFAAKMPKEGPAMTPEREETVRRSLREHHDPSERARDANRPVGATANAIREALPDFQSWQVDVSKIDLNVVAPRLFDDRAHVMSFLLPPDFARESQGAYITAERDLLIRDEDGSVVTMGELIARKTTQEAFRSQLKTGGCMSDTLGLLWKQAEPLDLQAVERLLRRLAEQVIAKTPVRFYPYEEPRYRAALRMQLGDNPVPAAIGGVHRRWSILPEGVQVASVGIHLEPWASARTGQVVELVRGTPFPSLNRQDNATA
ncbi:MAG TPA: sigma-70 family RNA polymerase sigma factor [Sedimentisphaerales bacterium]|jgi:RNA polymerase sigma factor (sigma-70 family)|nr:sigma-70 family RNA polymerase sigma factor [Sedimentisphaerales bacterium]HNU29161.1 sigma-70 family RNA polymerase sigma factor [Sedimentisphaerales bacterium]